MQKFSPPKILKRFLNSADWRLALHDDRCEIAVGGNSTTIDCLSMQKVSVGGFIFSTLLIRAEGHAPLRLKWLVGGNKFKKSLAEKIQFLLAGAERSFYESMRGFYIANHDFQTWRDALPGEHARFFAAARKRLNKRNEEFVAAEENRFREFFDTVENNPMTGEQRRAAIVMEDNNLLVAAAGSGKTSVIVGKVGYLLKKGYCKPGEILVLAFNRKAVKEMDERIKKRLGYAAEGAAVKTFHKCGLDIIAQVERVKPSVAEWTVNMGEDAGANNKWEDMVNGIAYKDKFFNENITALFAYFRWAVKPLHLFKSRHEYQQYLDSQRTKRSDGAGRKNWGAATMNGEYVRSMEEVEIANWLYVNRIEYKYEARYEHPTADERHREYKPDFYYPQIDVYHEHFAINEDGKAPPFLSPDYVKDMDWKRATHARHQTELIETNSAMFARGEIFERLKERLQAHGMKFNRRRGFAEIAKKLQAHFTRPLYDMMLTFLTHWKSSGMNEAQLTRNIGDLPGYERMRASLFARIMIRVRKEYEEKLLADNEIDFEDMLCKAEAHLRNGRWRHPYKIILVDEFQDVSRSRARLVKAMLKQSPGCKMFAVGDDWQSVYRFAGADISVMSNFSDMFGATAVNRLSDTFRSNQGIANVAADFVSKNPSQLSKQVRAQDAAVIQVVFVANYFFPTYAELFIERQLSEINANAKRASVYILARYNFCRPDAMQKWRQQYGAALDIQFSTIHSAKGREADYVFVLDVNAGEYGFPSEIEDDPVLQLVMPKPEKFPHAEERRLFYVALTRARRKAFLLTKKQNRSPFVDEVLANGRESVFELDIIDNGELKEAMELPECPRCGGFLTERTGHSVFWGCSNFPRCRYTRSIAKPEHNR